jgi:hypothetical protein
MTKIEQQAFVVAYSDNVGHLPADQVADFVARYNAGENIKYISEHTGIMDALGMWHCAIQYQLQNQKG